MPYSIERDHPDCPADKPVAVVADDTGEKMGCHANEDDANAQIAALYANEPEAAPESRMEDDPLLTAVYDAFQDQPDPDSWDPAQYQQGRDRKSVV